MKGKKRDYGNGTVVDLGDGKFRAKVSAGKDPVTGKRIRLSKNFPLMKDAWAWIHQLKADQDAGKSIASQANATTFGEWLDIWLREKKTTTSPRTYAVYAQVAKSHLRPGLGAFKLRDLTADNVSHWRDDAINRLSVPTVHRCIRFLVISLNDAVRRGKVGRNVAIGVKRPKLVPKDVEVFSEAETVQFLTLIRGHRLEALFSLLLDSGCRTGEALGLLWGDVDLPGGKIKIVRSLEELSGSFRLKEPKTRAGRRVVSLTPRTLELLAAYRKIVQPIGEATRAGAVFVNKSGGWVDRGSVGASWRVLLANAGIPYRKPYSLRHTCASLLLSAGASIKVVQRRLGHEDPLVTLRSYSHLMPEDESRAVLALSKLLITEQESTTE